MLENVIIKPAAWCEYEYRRCPDGCQIEVAENRLREAHRRWHECADSYSDPDDFRDGLNSAIQALRNVTFALQSEKSRIDGFAEWYSKEQESMKQDPVLRWSLDSRNTIVKQGELNTLSRLKVTLVPSYGEEAMAVMGEQLTWEELRTASLGSILQNPVNAPVELTVEEVLEGLNELDIPMSIRQGASVILEHRWVDEKMPEYELLSLLAHAYGRLSSILARCHELMGMRTYRVSGGTRGEAVAWKAEILKDQPLDGKLPCMVSTRHHRITRFRLVDGTEVKEYRNWKADYDPEVADQVRESRIYGDLPELPRHALGGMQSDDQLARTVETYAEMARGILRSGQDHGWFTYYFRRGSCMGGRVHMTVDTQGKHAISADIARAALEYDADALVMIGEVWTSPMQRTIDGAYVPPSLHAERTEAVAVTAISRSGASAGGLLSFRVLNGEPPHRNVEIGEFSLQSNATFGDGLLLPTRRAWGLVEADVLTGESFWRAQAVGRGPDDRKPDSRRL
ncbi:hypothetical protein AB4Z09_25830 [Rhodococcus sp. TAF43]|uniref:hypothetical protein n=1 Tax=Rhodococcus sp. TAF43 TaxID=3237483 RepID=UPI003F9E5556